MKKTALVIMAAGIGSRFGGGIKQLEPVGPDGEIIIDYSIRDALEAGFDRIVIIIRRDLEKDFREVIGNRIEKIADVTYVFQELDDLPEGYTLPEGRKKPWGTGHAILACRDVITEPFAVINADDYYGKQAFVKIHEYLTQEHREVHHFHFCMAGFILQNTLSDHGGVTRGICTVDGNHHITGIRETRNIIKTADGAAILWQDGTTVPLPPDIPVSMNMWGLTPSFIDHLREEFPKFLASLPEGDLTSEFLLPTIINNLIQEGRAMVTALPTTDKWFGVTFREDKEAVSAAIRELLKAGVY